MRLPCAFVPRQFTSFRSCWSRVGLVVDPRVEAPITLRSVIVSAVLLRDLFFAGRGGQFLRGDVGRRTLGEECRTSLLLGEVAFSHSPYIALDTLGQQERADREGEQKEDRQESLHRFHLAAIVPQESLP